MAASDEHSAAVRMQKVATAAALERQRLVGQGIAEPEVEARMDAFVHGTGFLVNGARVAPDKVEVFHRLPSQDRELEGGDDA